jgi:hypothetical protein
MAKLAFSYVEKKSTRYQRPQRDEAFIETQITEDEEHMPRKGGRKFVLRK